MTLKMISRDFSVCKVKEIRPETLQGDFCFVGKTDEELSLVCETDRAPGDATAREDGWRAFRIAGVLDFSLTGVLAPIAALLADRKIGIFAVSTYNTDYILVRREKLAEAAELLENAGYTVKE